MYITSFIFRCGALLIALPCPIEANVETDWIKLYNQSGPCVPAIVLAHLRTAPPLPCRYRDMFEVYFKNGWLVPITVFID
jgi:hypothetical protein